MRADAPGSGRERVLFILKTRGSQTAATIAGRLGVSSMAVRQHLAVLHGEQLVTFTDERRKMGRPARLWQLTSAAGGRFPDGHAELAVGMLEAVRRVFGQPGLLRLTEARLDLQIANVRERMPDVDATLVERVTALSRIRRAQGFMAEARRLRDGTLELVENHCAIAEAANVCPELCQSELSLVRRILGEGVRVERVEHILSGDRRCCYHVSTPPQLAASTNRAAADPRPPGRRRPTAKSATRGARTSERN